jgi:hypothetical protein
VFKLVFRVTMFQGFFFVKNAADVTLFPGAPDGA